MLQYLVTGGAALFKKRTSFFLSSRKSKNLLAMDGPLAGYPKILESDFAQRMACLVAVIGSAQAWVESKQEKIDAGKSSRRYPAVKAVLDEAVLELQQVKSDRANANWDKLRNATDKIIPAGSIASPANPTVKHLTVKSSITKDGVHIYDENNWLEVLDNEHHRGHEISKYFKIWAADPNEKRSFWDYLKSVNMTDKESLSFKGVQVKYVEDLAIRTLFELDFDNGKIYSRMNPLLQTRILGTTSMDRKTAFALADEAVPLNTLTWPSKALVGLSQGWAAYVMSTSNIVYAGVHMGGTFHHSSFLAGAPVLAAGMIKVQDGIVKEIHEKNGHYQAKEDQLIGFLRFLKSKLPGLNMATLPVNRFSGGVMMAAAIMGDTASKNSRAGRLLNS